MAEEKTMWTTLRLGIFVVIAMLIFTAGVFLIGRKQLLFSSTYRLRADFQNVAGLNNGADVRLGGIHQGTVDRIDLPRRPGEKVSVVMNLDKATRGLIRKDSIAVIKTEGLLGNKYVEVSFGSEPAEKVNNGDTIGSEPPLDFSDLIKKTNQILDTTKDTMENVEVATNNLKSTTAKIDQGKGTMGALVNDKTLYQNTAEATASAKAGAAAFQDNMEALSHNFLLRGFFKKRGYEDSSELTAHEIPRLPAETPIKKFAYDGKQIFDKPDTAKLKNQKTLNEAGSFLQANPFGVAVVVAAEGLKGDSDKHRLLSKARAMVVRKYLAENFKMDDSKVKTMGVGESKSVGDDSNIEILVYPDRSRTR
jgi:phospholipid/cholesterol/gamma-HCH transport system substrate-binding protein